MKSKTKPKTRQCVLDELHGNSESERLLHRLHSVALVLAGYSASEAARIFDDSPRAVAYWVTRFKRMGIGGLRSEPRSGRPAVLTAGQMKTLQTFVKERQADAKPLNAKITSQYIKRKFGIDMTERHCWRILKRLKA
jgi:transposase